MSMEAGTSQSTKPNGEILYDAFKASPIGIALENLEGQPVFVNPALCKMLGFTEEEMRGRHCIEFSPAEDAKKDWALFEQLRAGQINDYQIDKRFLRRDGSLMWGRLSISLFNRESPFVIAMVEDITERRFAEETRFRHVAIVQSSEDAIISKSLDGLILSWNPGARHIFGYTEAEAIGKPITMLIPAELIEEEREILERVKAGDCIEHYETVRVTKAGKRVDMSLSIFPTRDSTGIITGFSGIGRDITERKRTGEALRKSEEKFSRAFHQSPLSLTLTRVRDHRYLDVNQTFERLTGWRREEVIGRTPLDIGLYANPAERIEFVNRLKNEGVVRDVEIRYRRRDGAEKIGLGSLELIEIENEPCMLAVLADITERKDAEKALSGMSRKLIEAQEQERASIARELHDDICQRLALLAIELEQIEQNPPGSDSQLQAQVKALRVRTMDVSVRIQALSHELHSSKLEYLGLVAAMRSWCKEFADLQKMEIQFKSHDVATSPPPDVSLCLFRVLQEGLHNAAKHSGVKNVEVQLGEKLSEIFLTIRDLGRGFEMHKVILERGLGLTSMQERVRIVNGTISIETKPMGGTTIHVRIPVAADEDSRLAVG